jgi:murein DD-endopeptidase MepM/ murein hydrolase activator NlpD
MKCIHPFPKSVEFKILNPTGEYAHENFPETKYAQDFGLPLGTPVLVVKDGIVILAKYDSETHFSSAELENKSLEEIMDIAKKYTNLVGIKHDDQVFTEYLHLSNKSVVHEGQSVKQGDIIGYVGLSGLTNAPHLHFNAFIKTDQNKGLSIPVEFE